ncbi:MAG: hypothetical protein ACRD6N_07300, partial [Pyrinomonadaceae bacterium]
SILSVKTQLKDKKLEICIKEHTEKLHRDFKLGHYHSEPEHDRPVRIDYHCPKEVRVRPFCSVLNLNLIPR